MVISCVGGGVEQGIWGTIHNIVNIRYREFFTLLKLLNALICACTQTHFPAQSLVSLFIGPQVMSCLYATPSNREYLGFFELPATLASLLPTTRHASTAAPI
jgi:hypothetical protein